MDYGPVASHRPQLTGGDYRLCGLGYTLGCGCIPVVAAAFSGLAAWGVWTWWT